MARIKIARGTEAALDALAGSDGLVPYQLYWVTDEEYLAIATSLSAYETIANEPGADGDQITEEIVITGTTYTLLASDAGKMLVCTSDDPVTINTPSIFSALPPNRSVITILQYGEGQVTVVASIGGMPIVGAPATAGQYQALQLYRRNSMNTLVVLGGVEPD